MLSLYSTLEKWIRDHIDADDIITYDLLYKKTEEQFVPSSNFEKTDPQTKFINESGLYSLIFGSKKARNKMDDSQYMPFSHLVTSLDDADRIIKNMKECKVLSMESLDVMERAVALMERMKAI